MTQEKIPSVYPKGGEVVPPKKQNERVAQFVAEVLKTLERMREKKLRYS